MKFVISQLKTFSKDKPLWILLYLVSAILALIVAVPFFIKSQAIAGSSMEVSRLLADFDFMTFSDFWANLNKALKPQFLSTLGLGFLYLFISIYFAGGVLYRLTNPNTIFNFRNFFSKSWDTFPRYLLIYIFLVLMVFCFFFACGIFYFIFTLLAESGNEKSLILWMIPPSLLLFYSLSFSVTVSDYAKMLLYKYPHLESFKAFSISFGYVFKRPRTLINLWILVLLSFLLFGVYLLLDKYIGMTSTLTVVLFFVIQQLVSFVRIFLRYAHLGIAYNYFEKNPIEIPEPPIFTWEEEILLKDDPFSGLENEED